MSARRLAPWLVVVVLIAAYPVGVLAGDMPRFPSRDDCVRPATSDGEVEAVFGYFDSERDARALRGIALGVGFRGTEVEWNACGRVRVVLGGIPSLAVGRALAAEADSVGLEVTLEQAG